MKLQIITAPNPILNTLCREVSAEELKSEKFQEFMSNLIDTCSGKGAGLASTQVGSDLRCFVCIDEDETLMHCINPKIIAFPKTAGGPVSQIEGCLSFPGMKAQLRRARAVVVEFTDLFGQVQRMKLKGLACQAFQHEMDHINGITLDQRATKLFK